MQVQQEDRESQQRRKRCCDVFFAPLLFSYTRTGVGAGGPGWAADMAGLTTESTHPGDETSSAPTATPSPFLLTRAISFWCGNPAIERTSGEIHYYLTPSSTSAARLLRLVRLAAAAAARQTRSSSSLTGQSAHQAATHSEPPHDAARAAAVSARKAGDAGAGGATAAATASTVPEAAQSARSACSKEVRSGSGLRVLCLGTCSSCGSTAEEWLQERCLLLAPRIPASLSPAEFCDFLSLRGALIFEHAKVLHGPTTAEYLVLLYCSRLTALTAIATLGGRCLFVGDEYHAAPTCELRFVKHIRIYHPAAATFNNSSNSGGAATDTRGNKSHAVDSTGSTLGRSVASAVPRAMRSGRRSAASACSHSEDASRTRIASVGERTSNKTSATGIGRGDGSRRKLRAGLDFKRDSSKPRADTGAAPARTSDSGDVESLPATCARRVYSNSMNISGGHRTDNNSNAEDETAARRCGDFEAAAARCAQLKQQHGSPSQMKDPRRRSTSRRGASPNSSSSIKVGRKNNSDTSKGRSKSACRQTSSSARSEIGHALFNRRGHSSLTFDNSADDEAYWLLLRGQEEDAQQQQFCAVCLERVVIPVARSLAAAQHGVPSPRGAGAGPGRSAAALSGAVSETADTGTAGAAATVGKGETTEAASGRGSGRRRDSDGFLKAAFSDAACKPRMCTHRHRSNSTRRRRSSKRTCRSSSSYRSDKAEYGVCENYHKCRTGSSPEVGSAQKGEFIADVEASAAATRSPLSRAVDADDCICSTGGYNSDSYNSCICGAHCSRERSASVYDSSNSNRFEGSSYSSSCISENQSSSTDGRTSDNGQNSSGSTGNGGVANSNATPGIVVTVLCGHSFHSSCLREWNDASCPVCRYQQHPHQPWLCFVCGSAQGVRVCLLCGFVGCGDVFSRMPPDGAAHANATVRHSGNHEVGVSNAAGDAAAAPADDPVLGSAAAGSLGAATEPGAPEGYATAPPSCTPATVDGESAATKGGAAVKGGAPVKGNAALKDAARAEVSTEVVTAATACMTAPAAAQAPDVAAFPAPDEVRAGAATSEKEQLSLAEKPQADEEMSLRGGCDEKAVFHPEEGKEKYGENCREEKGEEPPQQAVEEKEAVEKEVREEREGNGALWIPFSAYSELWPAHQHPQHMQRQGVPQQQMQQQQEHEDDLNVRKAAGGAAMEREHFLIKQQQQQHHERLHGCIKGHAQLHFEETLHTYALELETDRVWDFLSGGYVHFVVQERCHAKAALLQQKLKDEAAAADVFCSNDPSPGNSGGKSLAFSHCSCCGGEMFPAPASAELTVPTGEVGGEGGAAPAPADTGTETAVAGKVRHPTGATQAAEQEQQETQQQEAQQPHHEKQYYGLEHDEQQDQLLKRQKEPRNLCGACRVIYAALELQPCEDQKPLSIAASADNENADCADAGHQGEQTTQQQQQQEGMPLYSVSSMITGVHTVSSAEPAAAAAGAAEAAAATARPAAPGRATLESRGPFRRDETEIGRCSFGETLRGTGSSQCWRKVSGWITEFNQMLAASLDSQRDYYDEKIRRIVALYSRPVAECNEAAKVALQAVNELQAQVKREGHALAALEVEAAALAAEGKKMAVRHTVLLQLHERLLHQAAAARRLQEEEERRVEEAVEMRLAKIEDLQLQIREVSFHMQAMKQLAVVPGVEESTMVVAQRPATKSSRGRGRRRHLHKVASAQKTKKSEESSRGKVGNSSSACSNSNPSPNGCYNSSSKHGNSCSSSARGHSRSSSRSRTQNSSGETVSTSSDSRSNKPGSGKNVN